MRPLPRKRKVTYNIPGHAHFLTYSCFKRLPLLSRDKPRTWIVEALANARRAFEFDLWAYVIMPEHVHLLIRPRRTTYRIERILPALKRPVSARARALLTSTNNHSWLKKLTVVRRGQPVFRFWQAGGGHDHNLWNDRPILDVIEYIHANPVRRGLVERPTDWLWSSARFWAGDLSGPIAMDPLYFS
jgi:putative transposase